MHGSQPAQIKLTFADAAAAAPAPEGNKARGRVEARKRRNKKQGPEEGHARKQGGFVLRPTHDATGRGLVSLGAATRRETGKRGMESPTEADGALPLARKVGGFFDSCASKQARTELAEGLGNKHGSKYAVACR